MGTTDETARGPRRFRLAGWAVNPAAGELTPADGGEAVRLEPKVMAVLVELARRPGRVIGKEELLAAVWPDVTVTEDAVWRSIATLRRVLGDDPRAPRYIETLPRRGYRLLETPVATEDSQVPATFPGTLPPPGEVPADSADSAGVPAVRRRLLAAASVLVAALALALVLAVTARDDPAADRGDRPGDAAARYLEAARHYQLRGGEADLERAAGLYRRAIDAAPRSAAAHAGLAATWGRHYALFGTDRAMLGRALAAAERAVALDPRSAEAERALGTVAFAAGRWAEAAAALERARRLEPGHAAATFNLAVVYGNAGELDRARALLAGLQVDDEPEIVALYRATLGEIDYLLGDLDAARRAAAAAVELAPEASAGQVLAARLELAEGRPRAALERLRPLAARTPGAAGFAYWTARAEIALGESAAARRRLEAAASGEGTTAVTALGLLAHLRAADGERAGARRAAGRLQRFLAEEPRHEGWPPRLHAAEAAAALGDADAAFAHLDAAVARGLLDAAGVEGDPALAALAGDRRFRAAIGEMERRAEVLRRRMGR